VPANGEAPANPYKNTSPLETQEIAMSCPLADFEDSTLVRNVLAGRTECFTVLTNRHVRELKRRIGSIVRNATDVEDLLQELLIKAWLRLSTLQSKSAFRAWIIRVAINEALQSWRRERSRPICQALGDFDTLASTNESPLQTLTRAETTQIVRNAVHELPEKYQQVLNLREFEELSLEEIAESLRVSIPAVKTRLFRARRMLQNALQERGNPGAEESAPRQVAVSVTHRSQPQC
jgi:RNA polymerase sigma-70 factor (ECF subfamily)